MTALIRRSEIIVPSFDPLDCDVGLVDAVKRHPQEQEEIALLNDLAMGDIMEYALLREEGDRP